MIGFRKKQAIYAYISVKDNKNAEFIENEDEGLLYLKLSWKYFLKIISLCDFKFKSYKTKQLSASLLPFPPPWKQQVLVSYVKLLWKQASMFTFSC